MIRRSQAPSNHLWIIAGPNGSGKATIAAQFFQYALPIVNPNLLENRRHREAPICADTPFQMARLAIHQQRQYLKEGQSFVMISTLSGAHPFRIIDIAKTVGFTLHLIYVGLDSVALSYLRVQQRLGQRGYAVDKKTICRRYTRGLQRLRVASRIVDHLIILDNSGKKTQLIANAIEGLPRTVNWPFPNWFEQLQLSVAATAEELRIAACRAISQIQAHVQVRTQTATSASCIKERVATLFADSIPAMRWGRTDSLALGKVQGQRGVLMASTTENNAIDLALEKLSEARIALENWFFYQQSMAKRNSPRSEL